MIRRAFSTRNKCCWRIVAYIRHCVQRGWSIILELNTFSRYFAWAFPLYLSVLWCISLNHWLIIISHLVWLPELQDAVEEVLPSLLEEQVKVFILADRCRSADVQSFKDKMSQASSDPISKDFKSHLTLRSPAAYIYTSGTTGKASSSGDKCRGFKHLPLVSLWQVYLKQQ